jgi:hypothetical protein
MEAATLGEEQGVLAIEEVAEGMVIGKVVVEGMAIGKEVAEGMAIGKEGEVVERMATGKEAGAEVEAAVVGESLATARTHTDALSRWNVVSILYLLQICSHPSLLPAHQNSPPPLTLLPAPHLCIHLCDKIALGISSHKIRVSCMREFSYIRKRSRQQVSEHCTFKGTLGNVICNGLMSIPCIIQEQISPPHNLNTRPTSPSANCREPRIVSTHKAIDFDCGNHLCRQANGETLLVGNFCGRIGQESRETRREG